MTEKETEAKTLRVIALVAIQNNVIEIGTRLIVVMMLLMIVEAQCTFGRLSVHQWHFGLHIQGESDEEEEEEGLQMVVVT